MKRPFRFGIAAVFLLGFERGGAQTTTPDFNGQEWVKQVQAEIGAKQAKLTAPAAYEPAAESLAILCQSDPFFFRDERDLRPAWTPPEILSLDCTWVQINPDSAHVEFGGGFQHFGYDLSRDNSADTDTQNGWKLEFYNEDSPSRTLKSFTLNKTEHVETGQFVASALTEFERRVLSPQPSDHETLDRVVFLLKFDEAEMARKSIRRCAAANSTDWADQLLAYLIDSKSDPSASKRLEAWAGKRGGFASWLLAAYAYNLAGDDNSSERCTKLAIAQPLNDNEWLPYNPRFFGATVCAQMLKAGRYGTCAVLCDSLLAYDDRANYLGPQLAAIRNLAHNAGDANAPPSPPSFEDDQIFEPFKGIELSRLIVSNTTSPLSPSATIPADAATDPKQKQLIEYLDHRIAADPGSTRSYTDKITYLLSVKREADALVDCKKAAAAFPDWWRPHMALVVLGDADSRKQAEPQFRKWVEDHPAFIHWWYLSRVYRDAGKNAEAMAALQRAAKYPLENVDEDETWVPAAFAFDAASYALKYKRFDLVLDIARVWSTPKGVYNYFDDDIYAFRAAAELALGRFAEAKTDADKVVKAASQHALWVDNLSSLQRAADSHDETFTYDPGTLCGDWSLFPQP
jgi:tetratricopeptide (TPR) repeat protein